MKWEAYKCCDMAFCAWHGRDVIDVDFGGDEEDALDGIRGKRSAGDGVDTGHLGRLGNVKRLGN